jgi:hypothetical protein
MREYAENQSQELQIVPTYRMESAAAPLPLVVQLPFFVCVGEGKFHAPLQNRVSTQLKHGVGSLQVLRLPVDSKAVAAVLMSDEERGFECCESLETNYVWIWRMFACGGAFVLEWARIVSEYTAFLVRKSL